MNFGLMIFGPVTDRRTEADAYEPTMLTHMCPQNVYNMFKTCFMKVHVS